MRLKALLSVFAFVVIMAAGGLIYFRSQLGVSADTLSAGKSVTASGIVTDKSGKKISNLPFTAVLATTNTFIGSSATNADGQYNLSVPIKSLKSGVQYSIKLTDSKGLYEPALATFSYQSRITAYKLNYQVTPIQKITITASSSVGGKIVPFGKIPVSKNGTQEFVMTPDKNYKISDLKIGGKTVPVTSNYVFRGVTANSTIEVVFAPIAGTPIVYKASGRVVLANGKPLSGALVGIIQKNGTKIYPETKTNADGVFTVALPVGSYTITVSQGTKKINIPFTMTSTTTSIQPIKF